MPLPPTPSPVFPPATNAARSRAGGGKASRLSPLAADGALGDDLAPRLKPSLGCAPIGGGNLSYWLPLIVFIPHMIEEYPRFPAWATRHFGATSRAWYVYSHILLVAIAVPVCLWADSASSQGWGE